MSLPKKYYVRTLSKSPLQKVEYDPHSVPDGTPLKYITETLVASGIRFRIRLGQSTKRKFDYHIIVKPEERETARQHMIRVRDWNLCERGIVEILDANETPIDKEKILDHSPVWGEKSEPDPLPKKERAASDKIFWTQEEIDTVVNHLVNSQVENLGTPMVEFLEGAMQQLPEDRRRPSASLSTLGRAFNSRLKEALSRRSEEILARETAPPEKVYEQVEVEKPVDPKEVLSRMTLGELVGTVVDRGLEELKRFSILGYQHGGDPEGNDPEEEGEAEGIPFQNGTASRFQEGSIQEPEEPPQRQVEFDKRTPKVLVTGITEGEFRFIQDAARRLNIDLRCIPEYRILASNHLPEVDHVLVGKFCSHKLTNVLGNRYGKKRVFLTKGGKAAIIRTMRSFYVQLA